MGAIVARMGAGARVPIPSAKLTADILAEVIPECLRLEAIANTTKVAEAILREGDGAHKAAVSFLSKSPSYETGRCYFFKSRLAVWRGRQAGMRFSTLAAYILIRNRRTKMHDLELFQQVQ